VNLGYPDLKIIKGGPDFSEGVTSRKFISAFVTNTRLMGVLILYAHWQLKSETGNLSLHQFFYLETTEAGIESYRSIYGNKQRALSEIENAMAGGLGGEKTNLTEKEVYILLQAYAKITEDFGESLPGELEEYKFILEEDIKFDDVEEKKLFEKTCVTITENEQLINYFLIRYTSADFEAVDYLSYRPLDRDIITGSKYVTLCINRIDAVTDENGNKSYVCESLIEDDAVYRIIVSEIRLANGLVASFEKISEFNVSQAEAAMKLARTEYITVYEIMDNRKKVLNSLYEMYPAALKKKTVMGNIHIIFKNNNDHVKESIYRLNDDIKGIIYVTDEDQLLLASNTLTHIHRFENEIQFSDFGNLIVSLAKYEFKESVFYDFMNSGTGDFLHYIEFISDFDPDY